MRFSLGLCSGRVHTTQVSGIVVLSPDSDLDFSYYTVPARLNNNISAKVCPVTVSIVSNNSIDYSRRS